jgi:hypothetical protein
MRKGICTILLTALAISIFAQTKFEKGYYISNDGTRVECFINIQQTQKTPSEFMWKLTDAEEPHTVTAALVSEFGITGGNKYVSALVNIDVSSDDEKNPSSISDPEWSEQKLFLEVLIEGEATLYSYKELALERFFYKVKDGPIRQLVNKLFRKPEDELSVVRKNELFRQQLLTDVKSDNVSVTAISRIVYEKKELLSYFISYNKLSGKQYLTFKRKKEPAVFHLKATPGFSYSLCKVLPHVADPDAVNESDFPGQAGFRIGIEAELVIPYTNRQVSLLLEPTYHYYSGKGLYDATKIEIDYRALEFPIGVRYYFFHKRPLKAYINAFFIPGFPITFNSNTRMSNASVGSLAGRCIAGGAGISWKRLSAEVRYYSNRNIIQHYFRTKYSTFSVILGFRLF